MAPFASNSSCVIQCRNAVLRIGHVSAAGLVGIGPLLVIGGISATIGVRS